MATKKSTTAAKKSTVKKSTTSKPTTTKVTTVKAVEAPKKVATKSFSFARSPIVGAAVAELIGTFLLAGVMIAPTVQGNPLIVGFTLTAIVLAIGAFSGAHVNPLVTVGAWVSRKITGVRALAYVVAQALGALLALGTLSWFVQQAPAASQQLGMLGQGATELFKSGVIPQGKEWAVLLAELIGAVIFAFAVASAQRANEKIVAAFTVGLSLFAALILSATAASLVGGSTIVNPAVAIALQAFSGIKDVWPVAVYALVPLVGGVIGFVLNDVINRQSVSAK